MTNSHFDKLAWSKLDVFNQMGNIGSEVGRALTAKRQAKQDRLEGAFARGLDLIDYTVELWTKQSPPRMQELLIAREQFVKSIMTEDVDESLEDYFMQFAMVARKDR